MDRETPTQQTLHVYCSRHSDPGLGCHFDCHNSHRHLPKYRYPSCHGDLVVLRLVAKEMEQRVTTFSEFVLATVNDIKSIDSQTLNGAAVIKISFQPQVRIDAAMSQIGAAVNSIRFRMPPGVTLRGFCASAPQLSPSSNYLCPATLFPNHSFTAPGFSASVSSCPRCRARCCQRLTVA